MPPIFEFVSEFDLPLHSPNIALKLY
jgi:hypothetical protein